MSSRTPKLATVRSAWCRAHPFWATTEVEERVAEFDRMIAEVERAAAEKALVAAAAAVDTESVVWIADENSPGDGTYWGTEEWLRERAVAYRRNEGENDA